MRMNRTKMPISHLMKKVQKRKVMRMKTKNQANRQSPNRVSKSFQTLKNTLDSGGSLGSDESEGKDWSDLEEEAKQGMFVLGWFNSNFQPIKGRLWKNLKMIASEKVSRLPKVLRRKNIANKDDWISRDISLYYMLKCSLFICTMSLRILKNLCLISGINRLL